MLPDINGFDVCRRLRTDRTTMLIPVVMLTALNDVQHQVHGFRVGANAYVTKPYGVDDLFEAITAARAWRKSIAAPRLQGEIHVELNSEINFLKDLNDFLDAGLPGDAAGSTTRSCSSARRSWKWPITPSSGATCISRIAWSTSPIGCTTTAWKSWFATRGRASIERPCRTPPSPAIRSRTWTSVKSSAFGPADSAS